MATMSIKQLKDRAKSLWIASSGPTANDACCSRPSVVFAYVATTDEVVGACERCKTVHYQATAQAIVAATPTAVRSEADKRQAILKKAAMYRRNVPTPETAEAKASTDPLEAERRWYTGLDALKERRDQLAYNARDGLVKCCSAPRPSVDMDSSIMLARLFCSNCQTVFITMNKLGNFESPAPLVMQELAQSLQEALTERTTPDRPRGSRWDPLPEPKPVKRATVDLDRFSNLEDDDE